MRQERLDRENRRFDKMNQEDIYDKKRIEVKRDLYQAGKKNKGGAAFDIVSLSYENSNEGKRLATLDNDAMVRALMRSRILDQKNNGSYNVVTGAERSKIPVPHHERYNPIGHAGREMLSSSRRSMLPPSGRSAHPPSAAASHHSGAPQSSHSRIFGDN